VTSQLHIVPRLKTDGATRPVPHVPSWREQRPLLPSPWHGHCIVKFWTGRNRHFLDSIRSATCGEVMNLVGYVTSILHFQRTYIAWNPLSQRTVSLSPNQWQLRTIDLTFVSHDGNAQYWKHACFLYMWNWKRVVVFDSLYCFSSQTSNGTKETQFLWTHAEDVSLVNIVCVHKVCNFTVWMVVAIRAKAYCLFLSTIFISRLIFDGL